MLWDRMNIDEFAMYQKDEGTKVLKIDGIWWRKVRPFFYRPINPFVEIRPFSRNFPFNCFRRGFQHVVPSDCESNSSFNFFIYDNLQNYSFDILSTKRRNTIRKGIKHLTAKPLKDISEFTKEAYKIYYSFFQRTNYKYFKKYLHPKNFESWAKTLFSYPKITIIGIYHQKYLSAISISCLVDDIIFYDYFFSYKEIQKFQVTDFVTHFIRNAAASTQAKYIFMSMPSGKRSLDQSKLNRGIKLLKKPAYINVNSSVLLFLKILKKDKYNKIIGIF